MIPTGTQVQIVDPLHFYNGQVGTGTEVVVRLTDPRPMTTYRVEFPSGTGNGTVSSAVDCGKLQIAGNNR